ncbi:MAG: bifunctional oligoribonuclease/PAP phosphatase NrnA [Alkalispirochaeta sp.]
MSFFEHASSSGPLIDVPSDLTDFFGRHSRFIIVGHLEPDADCIGSEVALALALQRIGKSVQTANPGPFERQEIASWGEQFVTDPEHLDDRATGAIVVDCSSPDRIRPFNSALDHCELAVIDHHQTGSDFGDIRFVRSDVPANTILIAALIDELLGSLTPEEAQPLFLGLATDTGFFRFLEAYSPLAFEAAARLSRSGASPREAAAHLNSGRSWGSRRIIGRMLERAEQLQDGAVLMTYMTREDELTFGTRRDSDALNHLLLSIEGVRAIAVVKEKDSGCTLSFRANDETDVSQLAALFGGGGHQKASGAFSSQSLSNLLPIVRSRLQEI